MPLQATSGAASYDAFGGGVPVVPNYIEDVFSTYLYTGNGSTQTITNGVDLSTYGGLVWCKGRNSTSNHHLFDTARGVNNYIASNTASPQNYAGSINSLTAFNTNGFSLTQTSTFSINISSNTYTSWSFRKQPKFFDIQTFTGNGTNRTIAHNLGSVPACIFVKRTDDAAAGDWQVYHRSLANTEYLVLNDTAAKATGTTRWNSTTPTSTVFSLGTDASVNESGATYVAYLFAHDAGGFGLTGTDNVISCGSFTTDGSGNATVSLGYEPQWLLVKDTVNATDWYLTDTMRPWANNSGYDDVALRPNLSNADYAGDYGYPTATGFYQTGLNASTKHIYIAIRRGPMKVPTSGTSVFTPITATASTGTSRTVGFPADMTLSTVRTISDQRLIVDRLRGYANTSSATPSALDTTSTAAEAASSATVYNVWNTTALDGPYSNTYSTVWWHFRRAPSFFDEVCYTGTGASLSHNLGVTPELIIVKARGTTGSWRVTSSATTGVLYLETNDAKNGTDSFQTLTPCTATTMNLSGISQNTTNVAYLFATCAGVSKVGSYTGTGATQTINCGFTGGARFVMVKATSTTGNWVVVDTARGMVAGTDPYLNLNTTAAEVNANNIYTTTGGFQLVSSDANTNANGTSYIFLAVA